MRRSPLGSRPRRSATRSRTPGTGRPPNATPSRTPATAPRRSARRGHRRASPPDRTTRPSPRIRSSSAPGSRPTQRAHLDALTGALRREVGRLALRNEIERARRADGKFVVAFIDVDGLKGVNDRDGHAAGDRVLRMLAAIMRANLRPYDPIVRFGGDEFVCGIASIDPGDVQHRIGVMDQSLRNATGVGITAGLAESHLERERGRADRAGGRRADRGQAAPEDERTRMTTQPRARPRPASLAAR